MNTNYTTRTIWLTLGILSLCLGIVGTIVPLLPTTPFVLLSVYAFARSSPRLHHWLIHHHKFGPLIENWQRYGAINRRTKLTALIIIGFTPLITWFIGAPIWLLVVQIVILACIATFIVTRP